MRGKFRIAPLLLTLAFCAVVELWQADGRRTASAQQSFAPAAASSSPATRPHSKITIRVASGSFVMKDLVMQRVGSSTIIKGALTNKQARPASQATFEIRAYDRAGNLLRGIEDKTIFTVHRLKANASAQLNYGHGVWLQGIRLDLIDRIEVSQIETESLASLPAEIIPFASHAAFSRRHSEVEE